MFYVSHTIYKTLSNQQLLQIPPETSSHTLAFYIFPPSWKSLTVIHIKLNIYTGVCFYVLSFRVSQGLMVYKVAKGHLGRM